MKYFITKIKRRDHYLNSRLFSAYNEQQQSKSDQEQQSSSALSGNNPFQTFYASI